MTEQKEKTIKTKILKMLDEVVSEELSKGVRPFADFKYDLTERIFNLFIKL